MTDKILDLYERILSYQNAYPQIFRYANTIQEKLRAVESALKNAACDDKEGLSQVLFDIQRYQALLAALFESKGKTLSFSKDEATWLIVYFAELVNDYSHEKDHHISAYEKIYKYCMEGSMLSLDDESIFLPLLIQAFAKESYHWRARRYAERLAVVLSMCDENDGWYYQSCEAYRALGDFYARVCNYQMAAHYAECGAKLAYLYRDLALSAELLCQSLRYRRVLDPESTDLVDDTVISTRYGDFAPQVLRYKRFGILLVDPIEHSEAFQAMYDEVMEATMLELEREGNLHIPHQLWSIMRNEFLKRGISWRDPQAMNPRNTFS